MAAAAAPAAEQQRHTAQLQSTPATLAHKGNSEGNRGTATAPIGHSPPSLRSPLPGTCGGPLTFPLSPCGRVRIWILFSIFSRMRIFSRRDLPKRPRRPACNRALMFKEPRERRAAVKRRSRPSSRRQARLSDETASVLQTVGRDFQFNTFRHISRPRPINIHFYIFVIRHRHL